MRKKFHILHDPLAGDGRSPYKLLDPAGQEILWVNQFLDVQRLRGLSLSTLRIYAYDLLHFVRWWLRHRRRKLDGLNEKALLDYVRFQLEQTPRPEACTINHRLTVLRCLYRFQFGHPLDGTGARVVSFYRTRSPLGYGKTRRWATAALRLKQPRRVIIPLSSDEVAQFWKSFRTFRDLTLIALMLFDGLRSTELLNLQLHDVGLSQGQLRVHGKGNKERIVPLPSDALQALQCYLHLERPFIASPYLFVCLKGPKRGQPMTPAGLRSLFRYHRRISQIGRANAHRLRHTFGSDMVAAGISLPALMRLMGHTNIQTTMLYVELSPQEVWRQYHLAVEKRTHLVCSVPL